MHVLNEFEVLIALIQMYKRNMFEKYLNISNLIGFDKEVCLSYEYTQSLKMWFLC